MPPRPDPTPHPSTPRAREHLELEHDYIWARLPFIVPMAARAAARCCGGDDCDRLAELVSELRTVLLDHLLHEEQILAAAADQRDSAALRASIEALRREHLAVRALLDRLREASGLPRVVDPAACPTERALLRELALLDEHVRRQLCIEDDHLRRAADQSAR